MEFIFICFLYIVFCVIFGRGMYKFYHPKGPSQLQIISLVGEKTYRIGRCYSCKHYDGNNGVCSACGGKRNPLHIGCHAWKDVEEHDEKAYFGPDGLGRIGNGEHCAGELAHPRPPALL